ncbi:MAG: TetR/AcrR family transcriptional regulator [Enhydrobacter sp.]|nr:MAG: TetR/AcrR family transcriptional regulator [Enhydrobacter sp.]
MGSARQVIEITRRTPRQARSGITVETILEGAAQVLEMHGLAGFTTNAVALRAGVSIGTLYQYFADKNAVLFELARREMERAISDVARALAQRGDISNEERVRAMIRSIIGAFHGRQRARKAVIQAVLAQGLGMEMMRPVATFIAELGERAGAAPQGAFPRMAAEQHFVLTRAVLGAIRAAVLEEQPFLKSRAFEDELVRLGTAYLRDLAARPAAIAPA